MWERRIGTRELHFHLAGINNQNFIMRDDETGTWWQQISGEAIYGALRGQKLKAVSSDELSFNLWRNENPGGTVLAPQARDQAHYAKADWENRIASDPVVVAVPPGPLKARDLVVGVSLAGLARAFPFTALLKQSPVLDRIGGTPVAIVVGPDGKSVRGFIRRLGTQEIELYQASQGPWALLDSQSAGTWNFQGCRTGSLVPQLPSRSPAAAVPGVVKSTQAAECLEQLPVIEDYWFDWHLYHPQTSIYQH